MPIYPQPTEAGFTLIELLVVVTILALVASYAMLGPSKRNRFDQERIAVKLETAIDQAAAKARLSGREFALRPSDEIPGATLVGAVFPRPEHSGLILLHPDGSSSGGTIFVQGQPLVSIDWLTGKVGRAH